VWDELYPDLFEAGIITSVDGPAFACLCDSIARWRRAMNALMPTTENPFPEYDGKVLSKPERLRRESWKEIKAMGPEFGVTPSGRSRIIVPKREGKKLKDLMSGNDPN
jgi:P27 family predicted phage terminase small subunit